MYTKEFDDIINEAVVNGSLTYEQRTSLNKKAKELGIDANEFEIVLEGKLFLARQSISENRKNSQEKLILSEKDINLEQPVFGNLKDVAIKLFSSKVFLLIIGGIFSLILLIWCIDSCNSKSHDTLYEDDDISSVIHTNEISESDINRDELEQEGYIAVEPAIEGFTKEVIVNSASEANTARFTLDKEDESFSISMEPGNKIIAVLNSSEIRNQMFQGKWEIKDGQYVASLGIGNGADGTDIVITIPNTMETAKVKSVANGEEKEYKLNYLKYFKLEVDTSSKAYDDYAIERIKEFYKKYVFGHEEATDEVIHNYCTKKLAKKLADDYEEEAVVDNNENNGGGYAVWDFRSGAQDGDSDIQKVNSVEALGEGKYKVSYNDMGNKGSCIISVVVDGDKVLFDEIN